MLQLSHGGSHRFESYSAHHLFKHLQAFQIWIWGHFSNLLDDVSAKVIFRFAGESGQTGPEE